LLLNYDNLTAANYARLRPLTINHAAFLEKLVMQGVQKRLYNQGVAQTDLKLQSMKACVLCFPHWDGITNASHIALLFHSLLKKWVVGNMGHVQHALQTMGEADHKSFSCWFALDLPCWCKLQLHPGVTRVIIMVKFCHSKSCEPANLRVVQQQKFPC
jgi:hypothetical protein